MEKQIKLLQVKFKMYLRHPLGIGYECQKSGLNEVKIVGTISIQMILKFVEKKKDEITQ